MWDASVRFGERSDMKTSNVQFVADLARHAPYSTRIYGGLDGE